MLKSELIHPEILGEIAAAGHGSQILITDGNYPASTHTDSRVKKVYLNLSPGLVNATQTLKALASVLNIESATVMSPGEGEEPPIFEEFQKIIGQEADLKKIGRFEFYGQASNNDDLCLVIVTAEQRVYANIMVTVGVVA